MEFYEIENGFLLRLEKDEELHTRILDFVEDKNIDGATYFGIGASLKTEIALSDLESKGYIRKRFDEPLEICSLSGNISWFEGKKFAHTHATLARRDFSVIGGHVFDLSIGATCEIRLLPYSAKIERKLTPAFGLGVLSMCPFQK